MGFFDSIREGDALMQMFAGNDNPSAELFISDREVNAMRGRLAFGESLRGFARGRIVSKGTGFWVLTSEAIFVFGEAAYPYRMLLSQIESIQGDMGQYGLTLRLRVKGASYSVFGVSPRDGLAFGRMLARACGLSADGLPGHLTAEDVQSVLHRFKDAAIRIDPVGSLLAQQPELWHQWLAQSAELGMLLADEYAASQQAAHDSAPHHQPVMDESKAA